MSGAAPAPALGYSVVANLDGNRQITVQCFVGEDEDDKTVNAKLDRVFSVVDRQKARYDIVSENEELSKERTMLHQLEEDLARVDADFERAQAQLHEQVKEFTAQREKVFNDGYAEHTASGRRGAYQPRGQSQQTINAIEAAQRGVKEALDKNLAERDQHRQGVMISIERYRKAIDERTQRINGLERMLAG